MPRPVSTVAKTCALVWSIGGAAGCKEANPGYRPVVAGSPHDGAGESSATDAPVDAGPSADTRAQDASRPDRSTLGPADAYRDCGSDVEPPSSMASGPSSITAFTVYDGETDLPIPDVSPLRNGAVLNLATLPTPYLNIEAITVPTVIWRVAFTFDGVVSEQLHPPYMIWGDNSCGDVWYMSLAVGAHRLTATPYRLRIDVPGADGPVEEAGAPLTIDFNVIDQP